MEAAVLDRQDGIAALHGRAGAGIQKPHAVMLREIGPVRVPEENELRADALSLQKQPRQPGLDAEQMAVREKIRTPPASCKSEAGTEVQ